MNTNQPAVCFDNVVQRFRVIRERPDTLREVFAKLYRRSTTYHAFEALKHVSFQIPHGSTVGIIGRNGSGKSTILKIIAGVYKPSAGTVEVNGTVAPLIELGAGFHPELTGRENILINGLLLGLSRREIQELEPSIIDFAEIGDFIDAPVKQYSSGMYMRLAFSVATAVNPDILLCDEILAVGDAGFQEKCSDRLHAFRENDKTILIVSHEKTTIRKFCNRALLVHSGEIVADGHPDEVIGCYDDLISHAQPVSAGISA